LSDMPEVAPKLRTNLRDRCSETRRLLKTQVDLTKRLIGDVVERFDLDTDTEPKLGKEVGGILGKRGSIPNSVIAYVVLTKDNVETFLQQQASIVRRWFG